MRVIQSLTLLTFLFLPCGPALAEGEATLALQGYDPVSLAQGEQVAGQEDITVTRDWLTYRFANTANKERFESEPERYEIQMEGHCGAMPTGRGNPEIFTVYDEKIYIFASEECLEHFLVTPESYLEQYESIQAEAQD